MTSLRIGTWLAVLLAGGLLAPATALAIDLSVVANSLYTYPRGGALPSNSDGGLGGGLLLHIPNVFRPSIPIARFGNVFIGIPLGFGMGFEFGALYTPRIYYLNGERITRPLVRYPLLTRLTMGGVVSLGIGGYYGNAVGIADPRFGREEGGLTASLRIYLFPNSWLGTTCDLRYSYGVNNTSTLDDISYNDVELLIGFRLGRTRIHDADKKKD